MAQSLAWLGRSPGRYSPVQIARLHKFTSMLLEENGQQNLIASATVPFLWSRHILDSAQLVDLVPRGTSGEWVDLGTGAGFPGMICAILCPDLPFTLVEERRKRADWLKKAMNANGLENTTVHHGRLSTLARRNAAIISARAFASLPDTLAQASHIATPETWWLLPKGKSAAEELAQMGEQGAMFHVEHSCTNDNAGIIVGRTTMIDTGALR
ncbi:16S rRNA (guanine(527)-N(7))-methyltransferase RsmG [Croceicoccus sp. F390]|uniref:Ribosomal RNA small subunit methyltransferase G n=1 Tax=Croceicoccus esteveae TaxID=3075597 RepID=A0ABU2ZKB6_9SPHN|nr:16S rRNA (guanine(527)-N(7))-methyltransferase RsmG [Croceicoccus sp. F390]MDT0577045.1 16S rRNA (guanine(527)-N(7))-methyltransferase RsmG [Croceicoccus sp. F390]